MRNIKSYERLLLEETDKPYPSVLALNLCVAARTNNVERVIELLAQGASPDASDPSRDNRMHALHWAAEQQHHEIMKILLTAGAEVDIRTNSYKTPLHLCAYWGDIEGAEILLNAGAEIEAKNINQETPLMRAGTNVHDMKRNREFIKYLISKGADPFTLFSSDEALLRFSDGDVSWMPKGELRDRFARSAKSKRLFGI